VRTPLRALPATLSICALSCTLLACGAPAASHADGGEVELGLLRLGRKCEIDGARHVLDARFDVVGPVELELDTAPPNGATSWQLATGRYAITIRPDFSVWRDVAVAQLRVIAELTTDAQQSFEITSGAPTLVAYELSVNGVVAAFDAN
jgi:hypothetical protein